MNSADLFAIESLLIDEVAKRRKLGGYSTDAEAILLLAEVTLKLVQILIYENLTTPMLPPPEDEQ